MPHLAIAGGSSASLGRSIVTALMASKSAAPWNVVILSRTSKVPLWLLAVDPDGSRVTLKVVDYTSLESLASALKAVDSLISVTSVVDGTRAQTEINVLNAAIAAGCKRFAPAAWGFGPRCYERGLMQYINAGVWDACLASKDKIETGRFTNVESTQEGEGYAGAADLAIEGVQPDGDLSDKSGSFLVGLTNAIAEIPVRDDGKWPMLVATSMRDIGLFVVASLDLPRWEDEMNIAGDCITLGEVLEIAEEVTGKKFNVRKLTSVDIKKGAVSLKPDQYLEQVWVELKLNYCADEDGLTRLEPVVNRLCPEIKPISIREYMQNHWQSYQAEQKSARGARNIQ